MMHTTLCIVGVLAATLGTLGALFAVPVPTAPAPALGSPPCFAAVRTVALAALCAHAQVVQVGCSAVGFSPDAAPLATGRMRPRLPPVLPGLALLLPPAVFVLRLLGAADRTGLGTLAASPHVGVLESVQT
jgi:hypothetical protein